MGAIEASWWCCNGEKNRKLFQQILEREKGKKLSSTVNSSILKQYFKI
jgi:hypothetical protein